MTMTVGELISLLQQYDEDAEVFLMEQPSYPFEYSVKGVISREEIMDRSKEEDGETEELGEDENKSDVFILEGTQLRYGNKVAWSE